MILSVIMTVGYITGCIWGLYLDLNIIPIVFLCIFVLYKSKNRGYVLAFVIFMLIARVRIRIFRK